MSRMVMRVSGHIMMYTRTGLRSETLQSEANCATMGAWLGVWQSEPGCEPTDCDRYDYHKVTPDAYEGFGR
jgi:hypothetical protein